MVATETTDIEYICDYCDFQKVQEWLSEASNLAIITTDFKGNPITLESNFSKFCSLVRTNNELNENCLKCDSRGGLEAARQGKQYIYRCHMGLVDFAIPIIIDDQYLVTVLAGQIVLKDEKENELLEKIASSSKAPLTPEFEQKLKKYRALLPRMTLETIQVIANMIFKVAKSMIEDAQKETQQNIVSVPVEGADEGVVSTKIVQIIIPQCDNPLLEPALQYIKENYAQKISLDAMAEICNISSSYFSKLFNKMVGENFNNYINIVRIKKACELLTNTSHPITVIALDVGFDDSSYFNQVFKHLTAMTPTYYRAINRTRAADTL